jgi:hypothetical protein
MTTPDDMPDPAYAASLSDELLTLSRSALDAGIFETAYHALAGALHGAESAGDDDRLRAIQVEASRQQDAVDARAPAHRLSRGGGRERGHGGWYDALAGEVTTVLARERAEAGLERIAAQREQAREETRERP